MEATDRRTLTAPVHYAAPVSSLLQHRQTAEDAVSLDCAIPKRRAACSASMDSVRAAKALVWRDEPLVRANQNESGATHVLRGL